MFTDESTTGRGLPLRWERGKHHPGYERKARGKNGSRGSVVLPAMERGVAISGSFEEEKEGLFFNRRRKGGEF